MSALTAALGYAAIGLRVIPLKNREKTPRFKGWPENASVDRRIIAGWFEKEPEGNLGLAMGEGFVAIDFDASRGGLETYRRLFEDGDLPETATAQTGGGGRHRIYRTAEPIGNRHDLRAGMDVKGVRGYIVADPSIHPNGEPYVWTRHPGEGISQAPLWLPERLRRPDRANGQADTAGSPESILGPSRRGDVEFLAAEIIQRYPVLGIGRRNDQMVRCIASLLARGFEDRTVQDVVAIWWRKFHDLGLVGTSPAQAPGEIKRAIASMRRSPRFVVGGGIDHRAACRAIEITEAQRKLIGAGVSELRKLVKALLPLVEDRCPNPQGGEDPGVEGEHQDRIGVTSIRGRLSERLCDTLDETAFVEAILVQAIHELGDDRDRVFRSTLGQLARIANDRHPVIGWDHRQLERLKAKYIRRPGKPATLFELIRETAQGQRGKQGKPGQPSTYRATGLGVFL